MTLEELKAFLESPEGKSEGITTYLRGLYPATLQSVQQFAETAEGKSWLDSAKDKHLQKGLETWKANNLEALLDAEIKKRFPAKDPKDLELEKLKTEIDTMKTEKQRESLHSKALQLAGEKGLPLELVSFFVGADEDATTENLTKFSGRFGAAVQKSLEQRLKTDSYTPPAENSHNKPALEDLPMAEYIKARQKG